MPQNWFDLLNAELTLLIFAQCLGKPVAHLCVSCADFNTLMKSSELIEPSKTVVKVEKETGKPFSEAV
eukprot:SAG11_NODE_2325_length_3521_cov_4.278995_1_plen_67_part_10